MVHGISSLRLTLRHLGTAVAATALALVATSGVAEAQVFVAEPLRPVTAYSMPYAAGYPGGYIANYSPAGNYAAVTAFSPPVAMPMPMVAAPVTVTSFYAPATVAPVMPAPVYAAPVTTFYAPAAVVPLYRRGPFGGLRPVRSAMYIPY